MFELCAVIICSVRSNMYNQAFTVLFLLLRQSAVDMSCQSARHFDHFQMYLEKYIFKTQVN